MGFRELKGGIAQGEGLRYWSGKTGPFPSSSPTPPHGWSSPLLHWTAWEGPVYALRDPVKTPNSLRLSQA